MNRYNWRWFLSDLKCEKPITVMSTFSCGGGSSMGYKRAGFQVLANVEIDPSINAMYVANNHPKYNFCMDLREFNKLEDIPEELKHLDILDGSPPCTVFSTAGKREETWGKKKRFAEGQALQTLDDLFFVFLDTVEKLRPRVVIAENVTGLLKGNARGYVNMIVKRFKELGYDVQIFSLNSATMDVPQARPRVFFIANRCGFPKLKLNFNYDPIPFGEVRSEHGAEIRKDGTIGELVKRAKPGDKSLEDVLKRITGKGGKFFTAKLIEDKQVCLTLCAGSSFYRMADKMAISYEDMRNVSSFPQDYNFAGKKPLFVCGMSVPPNMMANIATEVYEQWLKK